MKKVIEV